MSTARSSAERGPVGGARAAVADVRALLQLRRAGLPERGRRRLRWAALLVGALTVGAAAGPAYLGGPMPRADAGNVLALLPSMALAFLVLAVVAVVAAAGGRELLPREEAVAFPVSTTADHLGALLLAPLNVAWLLQSWLLLGATSYAVGPDRLPAALLPVVLWVLLATALAQAVGWCVEGVRRGPRGARRFRLALALMVAAAAGVVATGQQTALLDRAPTGVVLDAVLAGAGGLWWTWAAYVVALAAGCLAAVAVGVLPARWALHRPMRAELGLEAGRHPARSDARSDLAALVRVDRASVWRSVPLRRGIAVLAVLPGLVAMAGGTPWHLATVLPGLVAAGGALLFGVNAWCLDARGALWRESLPVAPRTVFVARSLVLLELLLGAGLVTVLLAAVGSGLPSPPEAVAVTACLAVVCVQVVAAGLRWSQARPYAVDLRSARATPAPPVVMVGYSARLALCTTTTALVFTGLAWIGSVPLVLAIAVAMLAWSGRRWERTALAWADPGSRARVVACVSG